MQRFKRPQQTPLKPTPKHPYEIRYFDGDKKQVQPHYDLATAKNAKALLLAGGVEAVLADVAKARILD